MNQANYHYSNEIRSIYIHIPFCLTICSYCDFCKLIYNEQYADMYLDALELEIKERYRGEEIETIYIGGGTPSALTTKNLEKLFKIIDTFKIKDKIEFTMEVNPENIDYSKLKLMKKAGVNRISVGVQTFNEKLIKYLNRKHTKAQVFEKLKLMKEMQFDNINLDIIYAIPNQSINDLEEDLKLFFELDISHISTYSLIIEPNTMLYIKKEENVSTDLDYDMYRFINKRLLLAGYKQYEISNYSKPGYESKHNLVYWNNNKYYGFGLGASGYINDLRYTNTYNIKKYLVGNYIKEEEIIDVKLNMEYEFILGFRKILGINKDKFYKKFNQKIEEFSIIKKLITDKKLIDDGDNIYIEPNYMYISNEILIEIIDGLQS